MTGGACSEAVWTEGRMSLFGRINRRGSAPTYGSAGLRADARCQFRSRGRSARGNPGADPPPRHGGVGQGPGEDGPWRGDVDARHRYRAPELSQN
jgi:hypothetical protein